MVATVSRTRPWQRLAQWLIALAVAWLVIANGASQLLEASDPGLALSLDPFDTNARANDLVAKLSAADPPPNLDALRGEAQWMISAAPADARGYSLLGEILERQGMRGAAYGLYEKAIALSGTEVHALIKLLDRSLAENRPAEAIGYIDTLLRRWPEYWPQIAPAIVPIALTAAGGRQLAAALDNEPPWRSMVLQKLVGTPQSLPLVENMLIGDANAGRPPAASDLDQTIAVLIGNKSYDEAYGLFTATLSPEQRKLLGYVYDPSFTDTSGGRYFGWKIGKTPDADVALLRNDQGTPSGLGVSFIDVPARLGNVSQTLNLPAGRYRLRSEIDARGLEAPKGLFWRLTCATGSSAEIGRLDVPVGSYSRRPVEVDVELVPDACPIQTLTLSTGIVTSSQLNPYHGDVTFRSVSIERQMP